MNGIPIARVFGIEIRVQLGWAIVLAIVAVVAVGELTQIDPELPMPIAWLLGGLIALGFFLSSASHDLAHAIVAKRRGVDVSAIGVSFFGGASPFDPTSPDPGHDAAIAASGPLVSLGIGVALAALTGVVFVLDGGYNAAAGVLTVLVFLNVVLGVVNLMPAYPLDGGRIVRDLAWRRSGSEQVGWKMAARTGRWTGFLVVLAGLAYLLVDGSLTGAMVAVTGWFLVLSANAVRDRLKVDDLVGGYTVADAMDAEPTTVSPTLTVDTFASQLLDGASALMAVPVVEGDEVVGILGAGQVRRMRRGQWTTTRVADVMAKPPRMVFLDPSLTLKEGLERLTRSALDGLPVTADGALLGVLTRRAAAVFVRAEQDKRAEDAKRVPEPSDARALPGDDRGPDAGPDPER